MKKGGGMNKNKKKKKDAKVKKEGGKIVMQTNGLVIDRKREKITSGTNNKLPRPATFWSKHL